MNVRCPLAFTPRTSKFPFPIFGVDPVTRSLPGLELLFCAYSLGPER